MPVDSGEGPITLDQLPDPVEIGGCHVEQRIAASSTSRMFRGVDRREGRSVAIKLFAPSVDAAFTSAALAHTRRLLGLAHPNVVSVFRCDATDAGAFVVFEFVDGEDLQRVLQREGVLALPSALRAIVDAAKGLAAAGIAHGDVQPCHLLRARGTTLVTGFGLSPPTTTAHGRQIMGGAAYVAPEIVKGAPPSMQSDMYALGATLFELATGMPPFGALAPDALLACALHEAAPALPLADAPPEARRFVARLLHKDPRTRFHSYDELVVEAEGALARTARMRTGNAQLVIEAGRQQGTRIALPEGDLLLGRIAGEGFAVDDARVSRRHAIVRKAGNHVNVVDLGSRNGVLVNGVRVRETQLLTPGDRLEIGDTRFRLEASGAATSTAIPASPLRGADGDIEIVHAPAQQRTAVARAPQDESISVQHRALVAHVAPLAARGDADAVVDMLPVLRDVVGADDVCVVRVVDGVVRWDAKTAREAQTLSCISPALDRALPGRSALCTSVRVGVAGRWCVVLAPVWRGSEPYAFVAAVRHNAAFAENDLVLLEAACSLLSLPGA